MDDTIELYKFVHANKLEYHFYDNYVNCYMFIPFYLLPNFIKIVGYNYIADGSIEAVLKEDCICINIANYCEYCGIDPNKIFDVSKEKNHG